MEVVEEMQFYFYFIYIRRGTIHVFLPEHVSGVEREQSGERSGHISFGAESAFWWFRSARSIRSAPLAQPKMPFGMGGAREGLAGAQHPQEKPKHPHSTPIKNEIK